MPLTEKEALLLHNYYQDRRVIGQLSAPERFLFDGDTLNWETVPYFVCPTCLIDEIWSTPWGIELGKRTGLFDSDGEKQLMDDDKDFFRILAIYLNYSFRVEINEEVIKNTSSEDFRMPTFRALVGREDCEHCGGEGKFRDPVYSSFGEDYEEEEQYTDAGITFGEIQRFVECKFCRGTGRIHTYKSVKTPWLAWLAHEYMQHREIMDDSATRIMEGRAGC